MPKDVRLNHYVEDGRRLLKDKTENYDVIFGDAYHSLYSIPMHLTTKEFFQTAYDKLDDNGLFIMNVIDNLDQKPPSLVYAEIRTLKTIFPNVYLFAVESPDTKGVQNLIVAAHKNKMATNLNAPALQISRHAVIQNLAKQQVDLSGVDFSKYPIVTDDYAPVEKWTAELLSKYGQ